MATESEQVRMLRENKLLKAENERLGRYRDALADMVVRQGLVEAALEKIVAEASAFSEYDEHTNDAFLRICGLAEAALAAPAQS